MATIDVSLYTGFRNKDYYKSGGTYPTLSISGGGVPTDLTGYYTKTQIDASFYTQTWINNNFDNYQGIDIYTEVFRERLGPESSLNFRAGTGMSLNYDTVSHTLTYTFSGYAPSYDGWILEVEGTEQGLIQNTEKVDFIGGTGMTIGYNFNTGTSTNEVTFNSDFVSGNYYTSAYIDSSFATLSYLNNNFDDYQGWDLYTTVFRERLGPESSLNFVGGTDIGVSYNTGSNTLTFDYTGSPATYSWYALCSSANRTQISNGLQVDFLGGTNITTSGSFNATTLKYEVTIDAAISGYVDTTTNQTVGGSKTFTGKALFNNDVSIINQLFVDNGATYYTEYGSETINFTRNSANYIQCSTAAGTLSLITNGLGKSSTNALIHLSTADVVLRYGTSSPATKLTTTSNGVTITGTLTANAVDGGSTQIGSTNVEINTLGTGNRYAFVDFHGDDTYTDYGLRIIRHNTGPNALSQIIHRGTGNFQIQCNDAGAEIDLNDNTNVTGNITATGEVTSYSSDRRLKENIRPIISPLDTLSLIDGVSYNWNKEVTERVGFEPVYDDEIGFIAQDLEMVLPQAVAPAPFDIEDGKSKSGENYLTVKPEKLIPLMVEAIKELKKEIEELKSLIKQWH